MFAVISSVTIFMLYMNCKINAFHKYVNEYVEAKDNCKRIEILNQIPFWWRKELKSRAERIIRLIS